MALYRESAACVGYLVCMVAGVSYFRGAPADIWACGAFYALLQITYTDLKGASITVKE